MTATMPVLLKLGNWFTNNKDKINAFTDKALDLAGVIGGKLLEGFEIIAPAITVVVAAGYLLYKNWDMIKAKVTEVFNSLPGPVQTAQSTIGNIIITSLEIVKTIYTTTWTVIKAIFTGNWSAIPSIVLRGMGKVW